MTKPQVILDENGSPAFAIIPWRMYKRLTAVGTDAHLNDEELYDSAKFADEESFPIELAYHLLAGESAVKTYRVHRGLTQKQLAQDASINVVYLSQIERGRRTGSTRTLANIAEALNVDIDDLI